MAKPGQPDEDEGYVREVTCRAPREQVFAAVATIGGLRSWWTPITAGVLEVGGQVVFGFEALEEAIVMGVDELSFPARVRWSCLTHTGALEWAGTSVSFYLTEHGPGTTQLTFRHTGLPGSSVAVGWDRFLSNLTRLVETGQGDPYRSGRCNALQVARAYHDAWTGRDFDTACRYLAPDLKTEVPINAYAGRDDFADAVTRFAGFAQRVDLVAEFGSGEQALLLYDMHTQQLGRFRVAEHFTVADGLIQRIRQVHDTAPLRAAT